MSQFTEASIAKLKHGGLDEEYARSKRVVPVTDPRQLDGFNQYMCPVPGMMFYWEHPTTGDLIAQYRPDVPITYPDGEPGPKYMFPEGQHQGLGLIRPAATTSYRVAIIEGTIQGLVFARYAPDDVAVYAVPGCWGWSHGETKTPTPALSVVDGHDVVIFVDADAGSNPDVWDGASELARACTTYGASNVGFGRVPVRGTNGVDDFLGSVDEDKRAGIVEKLLVQVEQKPAPRKPPAKRKRLGGGEDGSDLPPTDDTFLGTTWADAHVDEFRVVSTDKTWITYRDGCWSSDGAELAVGHALMEYMTEVSGPYQTIALRSKGDPEEYEKWRRAIDALLSSRKRGAVRDSATVYRPMHVRRDELDQHPTFWCAANGVINLDTGEVLPHDPKMLLTGGSPVPYIKDFPCPRFDQFMAEILPDPDVRSFVLRVFAMAMLGEVRDHVLVALIGEGRNGKGTLIKIMLAVFGSQAVNINAKALLKRRFDAHEQEIAQLVGKRLAVAEETGQGATWDVSRVNEWTGGGQLSGRFMHGNSFNFEPSHTLVMATNHRPSVGQGERAFWSRYREVPFTVSFEGREDTGLSKQIIAEELPGVLNRLLEALADYRTAGKLVSPVAVEIATADAQVESDHLARFVVEHVAVTHDHETDRIVSSELYDRLIKWWSQHVTGEVPPSDRMFPKLMRIAMGFAAHTDNPRKLGKGRDVRRTWTGVRWLDEGGFGDQLTPLVSDHGLSADIGRPPTPVVEASTTGLGDPKKRSADNPPWSADNTADDVDHGTSVDAGQGLKSVYTADTADKVVMVELSEENVSSVDQLEANQDHLGGFTRITPHESSAKGAHRQTRQIGRPSGVRGGSVVFDLETASADARHDHPDASEYVRIAGFTTGDSVTVAAGPEIVIDAIDSSRLVVGHNIVSFDLPALQRVDPARVDVLRMTAERRVLDTMIAESVLNPIMNDKRPGEIARASKFFALDATAERYGFEGKNNSAKALAKKWGGFDQIPVDDEEYRDYCAQDVAVSQTIARNLIRQMQYAPASLVEYLWREHRVHAIASQMGISGFQVDQPLLQDRFWRSAGRKADLTRRLIKTYNIPTTKADGKPADSPAATKEGKAAILTALHSLGVAVSDIPTTPKGAPGFGGDAMRKVAELYAEHPNGPEIVALCETVGDIAGVRTVYGTALEHLHTDGRVHPEVVTFQSSGRWSTSKPGLTVFGKRNGKVIERSIFTARDEDHVLMAIDLAQVDARAVAVHSQDYAYMDIFEPGRDSHTEVAVAVWGDPGRRSDAKKIGHGWNYNMGMRRMIETEGVDPSSAELFYAQMEERFPRLVQWKNDVAEQAKTGGLMDNGFGRLMRPDPDRAWTQGPALMGQGTARDLMMECLLRCPDDVQRMLRAQVHDEAVFEFPKKDAEELRHVVEQAFNYEWAPPGASRPMKIMADGGEFGFRWSACYDEK